MLKIFLLPFPTTVCVMREKYQMGVSIIHRQTLQLPPQTLAGFV